LVAVICFGISLERSLGVDHPKVIQ